MFRPLFLALFIFTTSLSSIFGDYTFTIQPRSYLFSTHYDIYSGKGDYLSSVEKNALQLHTIYSLCDDKGEFASGTARIFSLGLLFNSMREIDVVDEFGNYIGLIQGNWWTTASGKFAFYDERGAHCATAYADRSGVNVTIVDPVNDRTQLANFHRNFIPGGDYFWEAKVVKEEALDQRMLHVFAAFITDALWPSAPSEKSTTQDVLETGILLRALLDDDE